MTDAYPVFADERSVFDRISNGYYQFTEAERKVADYVVIHQQDTQLMSISELAEACGVAEATVSRFCRRLKYKGYGAFKLAVANAVAHRPKEKFVQALPEDGIPALAQRLYAADTDALAHTLALLRPESVAAAADVLSAADRVLCMGQGGSMLLAMEAAHLFSTALPNYQAVVDSHMQSVAAAHLTERDAVLFFSYSGATRDILDLLPLVRERQAAVILVTRFPKCPAAVHANVILQCGANELPLQHGSIPARMSQLFLVDLLFAEVCRRNQEMSDQGRERVAAFLSGKHL